MEAVKYFLSTVHRDKGVFTKSVAIHDTKDAAEQGFHNDFRLGLSARLKRATTFALGSMIPMS